MTESIERSPRRRVFLLLDLTLIGSLVLMSWAFANSSLLQKQPQLVGHAILLDLTLGVALCHGLVGVRLGGAPAWTLIPLLAIGLALGRLFLPEDVARTGALPLIALALVEGAVVVLVLVRLRAIVRAYRRARAAGEEPFDALELGVLEVAPRSPGIAAWVRLELQLWALLLFGWFFKPTPRPGPGVFTHHRESGWLGIVGVVCFVLLIEGALVHWWLHSAGYLVAKWVLFALHVYTFVWLIGDAQAIRVYRSSVRKLDGQWYLFLSVGLRYRARIALAEVDEARCGAWDKPGDAEVFAVVQGAGNVLLTFRNPVEVRSMLGGRKLTQRLLLQVDDAEAFRAAVVSSRAPAGLAESD